MARDDDTPTRIGWRRGEGVRSPAHLTLDGERTLCGARIPPAVGDMEVGPGVFRVGGGIFGGYGMVTCEECARVASYRGLDWSWRMAGDEVAE